nr:hypothetical protein Itr_chr13CG14570 [Ipomoea trifida]GLL44777.1 hypothetical protein Itr_chr13CG14580 [Ipomoea trifida]
MRHVGCWAFPVSGISAARSVGSSGCLSPTATATSSSDQGDHRLLRPSLFFRQAEDSSSTASVLVHGARTRSAATTPRSSGCGFATRVADEDHQR